MNRSSHQMDKFRKVEKVEKDFLRRAIVKKPGFAHLINYDENINKHKPLNPAHHSNWIEYYSKIKVPSNQAASFM